jgi:gluconolactonase
MNINRIITSFLLLLLVLSVSFGAEQSSNLIAPGAALKKVQSGFSFTEGPTADGDGNVYFTDITGERIHKWSYADGKVSVYKEKTGKANGLMFDAKGRLVICEMGNNRVTLDDMKGKTSVLADSYNGKKLHMPNDLWIDSKGGIYFSDFMGPGESQEGGLQVYYISPDLKSLKRSTEDLVAPNGLVGTPDGKTLYITDPGARKTWSYRIDPDATLTDKKLFCEQAADGMTLDEKGNVYLGGSPTITIYSPAGMKIGEIPLPENCTNLEFAGKDRKTLFFTAGTSVYTLEMAVRGAATALDQAKGK